MPSLDHETITALRILADRDRTSEITLAAQGVGRACLDALVARGIVRSYTHWFGHPKGLTMTSFALIKHKPGGR